MKKLVLFFVITLLFNFSVYGQQESKSDQKMAPLERIQQWEKMKLIEVLDLNEETSVKFFARRNEFEQKVKEIVDERNKMIREISKTLRGGGKLSDSESMDKLNRILGFEDQIMKNRESFLKSLTDILTPQQILKVTIFEHHFRNEIRQKLMEKRRSPSQE